MDATSRLDVGTVYRERFRHRDGTYTDYDAFWMRLELEGVPFWVPNPPAHGRALRAHDIHHVLTGYGTDLLGEAEISAFELASGCGRYVAALGFDLMGTGLGVIAAPKRTFAAFLRGRRSKNLFRIGFDPKFLEMPVREVQKKIDLDARSGAPRLSDYLAFGFWGTAAAASLLLAPISVGATILLCLAPAPREVS